jgi:hypothetical protein
MIGPLTELPLRFLRVGLSGLLGANFARSWLRFPYVFTCRAFGLAWPLLRALALHVPGLWVGLAAASCAGIEPPRAAVGGGEMASTARVVYDALMMRRARHLLATAPQ